MRDSLSLTGFFPSLQTAAPLSQESQWRSISVFNLYRLILGGLLLLVPTLFGEMFSLNVHSQTLFFWVAVVYTVLVLASVLFVGLRKPRTTLQLAFQICTASLPSLSDPQTTDRLGRELFKYLES